MNELQIFQNSEFGELGVLEVGSKPYFPATACAKVLGYANPKDAIKRHCRWGVKHDLPHPQNPEKTILMNFIPEGDLYRLIVHSKLPAAERFERWIFDEVLPTIRRTGGYHRPISEAELLLRLAQANLAQEQRISALERRVDSLTQPAASSSALYKPPLSASEETSMDTDGFMDSMEIACILGREHNNVLKSIRTVSERARTDGIFTDDCISPVYRRCGNNVRHRYYRLNEMGISLLCQSLQDWTLAEKLRAAFREKQMGQKTPGGDV